MKFCKKVLAALMAMLMVFSLTGCLHSKKEVALKIGGVNFTSAQYLYALVQADLEARQTVNKNLGDDADTSNIDYYSQKINKKKFVDYVEDNAIKTLTQFAAIITKCEKNKVKLSKEEESSLESYVDYYWTTNGYSALYEANGVSKDTFTLCSRYNYLSAAYFKSIYDKDGTDPVVPKTANETLLANFALANVLSCDFSKLDESGIADATAKFNSYIDRLNKGESFYTVYNEYNNTEAAENTDIENDENGIPTKPKDTLATVIGSDKTDYATEYYDTLTGMKTGEVKLYTLKDNAGLVILVKKDLAADAYYMNSLYVPSLYVIKQDEFDNNLKTFRKTLEVKPKKSVIKRLKVENITYDIGQR